MGVPVGGRWRLPLRRATGPRRRRRCGRGRPSAAFFRTLAQTTWRRWPPPRRAQGGRDTAVPVRRSPLAGQKAASQTGPKRSPHRRRGTASVLGSRHRRSHYHRRPPHPTRPQTLETGPNWWTWPAMLAGHCPLEGGTFGWRGWRRMLSERRRAFRGSGLQCGHVARAGLGAPRTRICHRSSSTFPPGWTRLTRRASGRRSSRASGSRKGRWE